MDKEEILKSLRDRGICIINNYWSKEKCEKSLKEISSMNLDIFEKGQGGDIRCQHSNKYLKTAKDFLDDPFINQLAKEYGDCCYPDRTVLGIVRPIEGAKIDSGGGWHVDSEQQQQFKSILYLIDVGPKTGPFMFAKKSGKKVPNFEKHSNLRISEQEIVEKIHPDNICEITGQAGTCILVDTTYPHRGKVIQSGKRYSFTTYFYREGKQ